MKSVDQIISDVVDSYQRCYVIAVIISIVLLGSEQNWIGLILFGPAAYASYFIGLWVLGKVLSKVLSKQVLIQEFQARRIRLINERLESGDLKLDDPNFHNEIRKAGLKPISTIESKGPQIGMFGEVPIYEYIDAKEGDDPNLRRYSFVGQAKFHEEDGTVDVPETNSFYIVLDGVLYEHTVE